MSKDKYLSTFLKSNGGYCVYYPSNIIRNTGTGSGCQSRQRLSFGFQNPHVSQYSDFVSVESMCLSENYNT